LPFATGATNNNNCVCDPGFLWNATSYTCYCPITLGWTQVGLTCTCPTSTSAVISGYCVDCATVTNGATPNANYSICVCTVPYQWSWNALTNVAGTCTCNPASEITIATAPGCVDCTKIAYSLGTVTVTPGACDCNPGFLWNPTTNACYCPAGLYLNSFAGTCTNVIICPNATGAVINNICVNCTAIPHNNGPDVGNTACACVVPYQWSWNETDNTGSCVCSLPT
jgi:hypothetical protein